MLPVIAIVGRPNVGKSTLFNALTRTRDALVADLPGVTRDRQYGIGRLGSHPYVVIDTGGLVDEAQGIDYLTAQQVHQAIDESDLVIMVTDGRQGLNAADEDIVRLLRSHDKRTVLAVNKTDGIDIDTALSDCYRLGLGEPMAISSAHRRGLFQLIDTVFETLPESLDTDEDAGARDQDDSDVIRLAVVGRPNVGKSTLVNRLLGEERVLAYDQPGTTRDTISVELERDGRQYLLLDTAGVRRRSKVSEVVEKFSVIKALQAIARAHVVVLMIDAQEGITDQDSTILGHVLEAGRALVIAINKWDGLEEDHRRQVKYDLDRKLTFVSFARRITLSALHGSGLAELMRGVNQAYTSATRELPTTELTRVLQKAFESHQPPMKHGRSAKLRYAHAGGQTPPRIVIHGNRTDTVPPAYKRYLMNVFRDHFKLVGTPVRIEFRDGDNPYKDKKNKLTKRQLEKRKRLKRFTSRKR